MPQTARAAMNLYRDLTRGKADSLSSAFIENLVHNIQFDKMIPRAQGPHLSFAPVFGALADFSRIRSCQTAAFFRAFKICF